MEFGEDMEEVENTSSQQETRLHSPFWGILDDVKKRLPYVKDDWTRGFASGYRLFVPTTYIFFASALPVIAFGEQLRRQTDGIINASQALISTALCGTLHSVLGGQPLMIVGVSEPTALMYSFMHNYVKTKDSMQGLFLAWAAWVCVWAAFFLMLLAVFGACSLISKFTRVAGELFGLLIALLFLEQAVRGAVSEFHVPQGEDRSKEAYEFQWRFGNGMFGLVLLFGVLFVALTTRRARSWSFGTGGLRSVIAGYGVPLAVLLWTAVSYAPGGSVPDGVPRRVFSNSPWAPGAVQHWKVVLDMHKVPPVYIVIAIVPALMITVLYYFDHSVSAQLAQQKEFNLVKPPSYHYDLFVLSLTVLTLKELKPNMRRNSVKAINPGAIPYDSDSSRATSVAFDVEAPLSKHLFDPSKDVEHLLPVQVQDQRLTNLLQSLLVGACVGSMSLIRKIPTSVLWGYFAFMAVESLPGNQFWQRIQLLLTSPSRRYRVLQSEHAAFMESVPFRVTATFTIMQLIFLIACFGITFAPVAGVMFPIMIMCLIPIRQIVLPRFFAYDHLQQLDAAEYEEAPPKTFSEAVREAEVQGLGYVSSMRESDDPEEIMDDVMTRGRGEIKHRYSPDFSPRSSSADDSGLKRRMPQKTSPPKTSQSPDGADDASH